MTNTVGHEIYDFATKIKDFPRSITGKGARQTLQTIKSLIPNLDIVEVPSGTLAFDWEVPMEWEVHEAYVVTPSGKRILDFFENNLHLVGYSSNFKGKLNLTEFQKHLHSIPGLPNAIPYVTSYYEDNWGFCLSQEDRDLLEDGEYYINVNTRKFRGSLTYGELIIKGKSSSEIFFSTYICHPVMANNELSGPSLMTFISKFIETISNRRYTYRIIFIPETIGSVVYLNKHLSDLKKYVCAGFNVTCIGDNRAYSFLPSRFGNTLSDNVARHILKFMVEEYTEYDWRQRGSDERQYCSPGVDLPIASIMRSKYGTYPEYHTSLDTLGSVVTPEGLNGGFEVIKAIIKALENNYYVKYTSLCEPAMSKRNLYPTLSTRYLNYDHRKLLDLLYWADGKHTLLDIANLMNTPISDIIHMASTLLDNSLILINDQEF